MILGILAAAVGAAANYDCKVDPTSSAIRVLGTTTKTDPLTFQNIPQGGWRFTVLINGSDARTAQLSWPAEPIQVKGSYPAYFTGNHSFAFVAARNQPCMFTDGTCLSLIHIVDESGTQAFVSVAAAGLSTNDAGDKNVPFVPIMHGVCTRKIAS